MERSVEEIAYFKSLLEKHSEKKCVNLYQNKSCDLKPQPQNKVNMSAAEVISSVSKQIMAIQKADDVRKPRKCVTNVNKLKKSSLIPANMLLKDSSHNHNNKFETQCVIDTQFNDAIVNVEAIDQRGMTQEFNTTFWHEEDKFNNKEENTKPDKKEIEANTNTETVATNCITVLNEQRNFTEIVPVTIESEKSNSLDHKTPKTEELFEDSKEVEHNNSQILNKANHGKTFYKEENILKETHNALTTSCSFRDSKHYNELTGEISDDILDDINRPKSPVFNNIKPIHKSSPTMTYNLETFEKFESIAIPIIEENTDLEDVKRLINSQIVDKELLINSDTIFLCDKMACSVSKGDNETDKCKSLGDNPYLTSLKQVNVNEKPEILSDFNLSETDFKTVPTFDSKTERSITVEDKKIRNDLEDEILFSSDEEDTKHKEDVEEIPFTCALETSFYNQFDVLDKTLYVGFQTASNKSISICADSFNKAKSILKDDTGSISLTELVEIYDTDFNKCTNEKNVSTVDKGGTKPLNSNIDKELKITQTKEDHVYMASNVLDSETLSKEINIKPTVKVNTIMKCTNAQFQGIKTASNRIVKQSHVALARGKKVFQGIDLDTTFEEEQLEQKESNNQFTDMQLQGFKTASNKTIKLTPEALAKCSKIFQGIDLDYTFEEKQLARKEKTSEKCANTQFQGFKTASNRTIKLSHYALERCNKVFQGIDLDTTYEHQKLPQKDSRNEKCTNIQVPGFKTASNKTIELSHNALQTSNKVFQGIDLNTAFEEEQTDNSDDDIHVDINENFHMRENKSMISSEIIDLKIDDQAIVQEFENNLMSCEDILDNVTKNKHQCNRKDISDKHEIPEKEKYQKTNIIESQKTRSQEINRTNKALSSTKNIISEIESEFEKDILQEEFEVAVNEKEFAKNSIMNINAVNKTNQMGFRTASNKDIIISDQALNQTSNIFEDIDNESSILTTNKRSLSEKIEPVYKRNKLSKIKSSECITNRGKNEDSSQLLGFKTASNKNIKISENAFAKVKNIFEDFNLDDNHEKEQYDLKLKTANDLVEMNTINQYGTFKTANNKVIKISKNALLQSKNKFKNIDTNNDGNFNRLDLDSANNADNICQGFIKTTNNKQVTIGDSLVNIKTVLLDINVEVLDNEKDCSNLLQIANNKPVAISQAVFDSQKMLQDTDDNHLSGKDSKIRESALAKNKQIFYDCKAILDQRKDFCNIFRTTNKEPVTVSEEAFAASQKLFKEQTYSDIDLRNQQFKGFQTASNKDVKISETALARSKQIFQDIDFDDEYTPVKNKDFSNLFQTANEKSVTVSEEAFITSQKMFKAIEQKALDGYTENNHVKQFRTASNKGIKISGLALAKSKQIFQDIDGEHLPVKSKVFSNLFQTASEKPVTVSEEAFAASQKVLGIEEHNFKDKDIRNQNFEGFHTVIKKDVNISERALARSKQIFQDIGDGEHISVKKKKMSTLFQTANEEPVAVSEEAFFASQKMFIDIGETISDSNTKKYSDKGFCTASNKGIKISDTALARSRQIFQEIDHENIENDTNIKTVQNNNCSKPTSIQSTKDNILDTPEKKKTRKLFDDWGGNKVIESKNKSVKDSDINIDNIFNTQILNCFEETLYTEDFKEPNPVSDCKRSGSPILSCPKAKKRKKSETIRSVDLQIENSKNTSKHKESYTFDQNYKKNKIFQLKDLKSNKSQIDPYVSNFNFEDLLKFEFEGSRNDLTKDKWTIDMLKTYFLQLVNSKIVPDGWLDNHIKLILWKLISYEIRFTCLKGVCTVKNLLEQLKYRYDRELYNVQRPALRKLLEKDDISTRAMVLCVVGVYEDGVGVVSVTNTTAIELLLTDGWYCIKACTDKMLANLVRDGKIRVGSKIITHGAELLNCEQGISPWEDASQVRLKIFGNSTHPTRWDARLGYIGRAAMLSRLTAVNTEGGKVSRLRVYVARVYPMLYVEKFEDGSTVTRSERLENIHQMKHEAERQIVLEKLYEEVENEFIQDSEEPDSLDVASRSSLETGSQIHRAMRKSKDPAEFRANLTTYQTELLYQQTSKQQEVILQKLQTRVQEMMKSRLADRNVVTLLKIRVADVGKRGDITKAMITIWRPNDDLQDIVKEGVWIDVYNVMPTAVRYSELQISAGRQSTFHPSKYKPTDQVTSLTQQLKRQCYSIQRIQNAVATEYNEIDLIGMVFLIDPSTKDFDTSKMPFQNVYMTDADKNFVCVNFWGGLKKFGYENFFDSGQCIACVNLQKRSGNTKKNIPQYRATELSYVTKTPKYENMRSMLEELTKKLLGIDRKKFYEDCIVLRNNYTILRNGNTENISPYRINYSDYNISRNKIFIESPLIQKQKDVNLNLTGLDFESTFKEKTQVSPIELLRKKRVNEKIAKLKMYGEPPPLGPIHIINKSKNATNAYKSPLICNKPNRSNSVVSAENPKFDSDISPVLLLNRTYVKPNINPVKLNFSNNCDDSKNEDPFAEEFDGSPPLSLD